MKTNSLKAWIIATRPYSLTGAAVPVVLGHALAWKDLHPDDTWSVMPTNRFLTIFILCLLFAGTMQIISNMINDYFDCLRGNDVKELRIGPKRACAEGWITMPAMKRAINVMCVVAAIFGMPLALFAGWEMISVGVACMLGAYLYTTHLSYKGLGDVLCLAFFGLIPICIPYYIQTGMVTLSSVCLGLSTGIVIDVMMMANNYRDIPNDIITGKKTLFVRIGEEWAQRLFYLVGPLAVLLLVPMMADGYYLTFLFPLVCFVPAHYKAYKQMKSIEDRKEMIHVLALASKNIVIYGIATTIGILLCK